MTIMYERPPVDNVRPEFQVDVPDEATSDVMEIKTVDEAIEVYLQAFQQKFQSCEGRRHRKRSLEMFLQYLTTQGHSLKLQDLTPTDGCGFLDNLTNHYDGRPLKAASKTKHWNAIRSFSRFMHQTGLIEENIFLILKKR
jgi:site-specific recombinase XerD